MAVKLIAIFLPFALAVVAPLLRRLTGAWTSAILSSITGALTLFFVASFWGVISRGETELGSWEWVPSFDLRLSFYIDGLTLLFLILIAGIGALVVFYSGGYMKNHPRRSHFDVFLFLFMGSMLGLVSSGNLLVMFIFWEMTSIASFLLIGFDRGRVLARHSARQALLVTGGGGLALFAGILLLGSAGQTFELSELMQTERAALIREHHLYFPALILILIGAFTKSAITPFHFWLPNAMSAPTPVSAYLHSATMVKAGVFLVARLLPIMGGTIEWLSLLLFFGGGTALVGPILALEQTDLKRLLAYSTVGSLGVLMMLLGVGTEVAVNAAIVYLFIHSLYKGALFMVAGAVDHEAGTRDVLGLSGLIRVMPITGAAAVLAGLSMAGFPPLFGFIGKELMYEAKLDSPVANVLVFGVGFISNMIAVAIAFMVMFEPFLGKKILSPKVAHEAPFSLWFGPMVLAVSGLLFGVFPGGLGQPLLSAAVSSTLGQSTQMSLKVWHGFNAIFYLSALTALGGIGLFFLRAKFRQLAHFPAPLRGHGPEVIYETVLSKSVELSSRMIDSLQNGLLSRYVLYLALTSAVVLGSYLLHSADMIPGANDFLVAIYNTGWPPLSEIGSVVIVTCGAVAAAFGRSRLVAVSGMGLVGFGLAILYAVYSAPDVAMAQVLVETLSVVLTVFLITWLPRAREFKPSAKWLRAFSALLFGALMSFVFLNVGTRAPASDPVSDFFRQNSFSAAKGRNIVNVILVDFRAMDTLGEITVLAVAAIGVTALLVQVTRSRKSDGPKSGVK
jgi:multicomponent Na+:H+ antiporter subunit A